LCQIPANALVFWVSGSRVGRRLVFAGALCVAGLSQVSLVWVKDEMAILVLAVGESSV
jgi:hypothetical protein